MQKNIFIASISIILASIFFVINDAIINYLSVNQIQFYHFVFYGSPAYLIVPLSLYFKGDFKKHLSSSNYYILLIRSLLFAPMPFLTFIALKNISLPEFTTLNMAAPLFASIYAYFFLNEKFNKYLAELKSYDIETKSSYFIDYRILDGDFSDFMDQAEKAFENKKLQYGFSVGSSNYYLDAYKDEPRYKALVGKFRSGR